MPDRFYKVDDMVFRGAWPSFNDLLNLKNNLQVNRIISLDGEIGELIDPACKALGLGHETLHLGDGTHPNVSVLAKDIIPTLGNEKTYIHCRYGKDRTGMACAMYRCHTGWKLADALAEAWKIGMGKGLNPSVKKSYYDAVKKWAKELQKDNNEADIVELTRDQLLMDNMQPAHQRTWNHGWADQGGNDHLNRPASQRVYRRCIPGKVLEMKQYWFSTPKLADVYGAGKLYSGIISSDANLLKFKYKPTTALMQTAMLRDADIVSFVGGIFVVFNPNSIINIVEEDNDVNDIDVGLHDNYTGMASFVAPGSGGLMESGTGGFAGFVTLPGTY